MATILEGPDCSDYDSADDDLPLSSLGRQVSKVEPSYTEDAVTVPIPPPNKRRRISCDDESDDEASNVEPSYAVPIPPPDKRRRIFCDDESDDEE